LLSTASEYEVLMEKVPGATLKLVQAEARRRIGSATRCPRLLDLAVGQRDASERSGHFLQCASNDERKRRDRGSGRSWPPIVGRR
jgi:hypothetical protein